MFGMKLEGTERLMKALDPARMMESLKKELRNASTIVMRTAKDNALHAVLKRRSGNLGTGITQEVDETALRARIGPVGKGKFTSGSKIDTGIYGAVNEFGATIKPLPPNKWLKFQIAPRGVNVTKGGGRAGRSFPWVTVAQVIIPKRPWLMPAYESNKDKILRTFQAGLQRSLTP